MKSQLPIRTTKSRHLIYLFFLLISLQSFADVNCGEIEGFEFTNGHESNVLVNEGNYVIDNLPNNFYINLLVNGYSKSVRYTLENLETGETHKITENLKPYTFPGGNKPWNLENGRYRLTASLFKFYFGYGHCDTKTVVFTLGDVVCDADAGSLMADADTVTLIDGKATISASVKDAAYVPEGYSQAYVLTMGEGLVIKALGATPSFDVMETGNYTIHSIVFDPDTLDVSIVVPGQTTGFDVNSLLIQGGGMICASLDVAGTPVYVNECKADAGSLMADADMVTLIDGKATISASVNDAAYVPDGYSQAYVLTMGEGLVIKALGATPSFDVMETGNYTIHSIVFDPHTLDVGIVVPGQTTGFDVNSLLIQGGGMICASLDVAGTPVYVNECKADAGSLMADADTVTLIDGKATISASVNDAAYVPEGYSQAYVLTMGEGLVIKALGATPSFDVMETGNYTIHSIVFDPDTLDVSIVVPGQTTGFDVNSLLIQGGGMICASLDVAGTPVYVNECKADAGSLMADADTVTLIDGKATISASVNDAAYVPEGYSQAYVLTMGEGLVIKALGATPSFDVMETGNYTIHSIVFDPDTLDVGIVVPGQTTGFDVNGLLIQGGGMICASLDVAGTPVYVNECKADAGSLMADADTVTLIDGKATISASVNDAAYVPEGYSQAYVLTMGEGLVIKALGATPSFDVMETGNYTIHSIVFDPDTLDVSIVVPGQTTGIDVNSLLIQGGGMICASLDVAGAPVYVNECKADAGSLMADADTVTLIDGKATISASVNDAAYVPERYSQAYVLTMGEGLVIKALGATPSFDVMETGNYTIHSIVFDPHTLDVGIVVPGQNTGFDVNGLLIQGGGMICASLDVAGAPVYVNECKADAGSLMADADTVTLIDGKATISASVNDAAYVPEGYSQAYVLTMGEGLVIKALGATPSFDVMETGNYTIHSIVFDPHTLDVSIVVPGQTTGFEVNSLLIQGGGMICASLDVAGAPVYVNECKADAGSLMADADMVTLIDGKATISASVNDAAYVPDGYSQAYVLTMGEGLVIKALGATPSFDVMETGNYTIHSIVFDPHTLDVGIVVPGQTTGFDVNGLLIQGGGMICASLDVAGAPVYVNECKADAGSLMADADMVTLIDGKATISASVNDAAYVPEGYSQAYVLTMGEGLVIKALGATPSFDVMETGNYTIHSIVFDPHTLDVSIVVPGQTTGFDVNSLLIQGGGMICASLDVAGAPVYVNECKADAGSLMADADMVTLIDGKATISASVNDAAYVPDGYSQAYVLTMGEGLVIKALGATPSFDVMETGNYTIHSIVFDPHTLDVGIVVPGQTTGFDVNGLLIQGGGMICASLDVAGAPVYVNECKADAGSLMADADTVTLIDGKATISASVNDAAYVPEGYSQAYVLTMGEGLVIKALGATPSFDVMETGNYTIHSIVFDPHTLDVSIVVPGQTTGFEVNSLLIQGGGMICASLDVAGAPVYVNECKADAGSLMADADMVTLIDGKATISASVNDAAYVPEGYSQAYVLTMGEGLVIKALGATPSFDVMETGNYTIHSIVFDPHTLDVSIVVPGQTTGFDVNSLLIQGGGMICASLDVAGAPVYVNECKADAGSLMADADMVTLIDGKATISASVNDAAYVPDGYSQAYVLTMGEGLVIKALGATPSFDVMETGNYTIHSIVFDPHTLDVGIVVPGQTTGFDVNGLLIQGGGMICASLDVAGAPVYVNECKADAGSLMADADTVTLIDGKATISASVNDAAYVPEGYSQAYVLTMGEGLVIKALGATPSFDVMETGNYTIHSIVFDPHTLDVSIVVPGQTTGFEVNSLLIQGGGMICASLDVAGAPVYVNECKADAGSLMADADTVTLIDGKATISASVNDAAYVPEGYSQAYVLTMGEGLVIKALGATPSFDVMETGNYTIHSIVFDPHTLDVGIVVPGQTTGFEVNSLLIQGGGMICASLDVAGAPVMVEEGAQECTAYSGTMYSKNPINCLENGVTTISAKTRSSAIVPNGYNRLFVLTEAYSLTILNVSASPQFEVNHSGFYRIHSLVYDPNTLDLSIVVPGQTTGFDVANLIANNAICASLDVHGAINLVIGSRWFCYFFNKYFNGNNSGKSSLSAKGGNEINLDSFVDNYNSYEEFKNDFIALNSKSKFFPNPVRNVLNVELELLDNEIMNYNIIDVSGRSVMSGVATDLEFGLQKVSTSRLNSGMYLVQFASEYRTITKKIIVKK